MTWVIRVHVGVVPVYVGETQWVSTVEAARHLTRNDAASTAALIRKAIPHKVETLLAEIAESGAVKVSRARSTGTKVHLYPPGVYESDPDAHWMLVCIDHGGCVGFPTRKDAERSMPSPDDWCPDCSG